MEINCQFIYMYGKFVTLQTAYFSRADINYEYWSVVEVDVIVGTEEVA